MARNNVMIQRAPYTGRKKYSVADAPMQGADWKQNWRNVFGFSADETAAQAFARQGTPLGPKDMSLPQTVAPAGQEWWQPTGGDWQLRAAYKPGSDTLPPIPEVSSRPPGPQGPKDYGNDMMFADGNQLWGPLNSGGAQVNQVPIPQTVLPPAPQAANQSQATATTTGFGGVELPGAPSLTSNSQGTPGNPLENMFPQGWQNLGDNYASLFGG